MRSVRELLALSTQFLSDKGIPSARLDAEVLLSAALKKNRVEIYCCLNQPITDEEIDRYRALIKRRVNREPVAYITGEKEFYGLPFVVTRDTLIPRPDTETLVEAAVKWLRDRPKAKVCDIGTGSGAIAVSVAVNAPLCTVAATDESEKALAVAGQNAEVNAVSDRVEFFHGDLFAGAPESFDLILSNPPYVCESEKSALAPEIMKFEPAGALFAGADGLDVIRRLVPAAIDRLLPGGALLIEIGWEQGAKAMNLVTNAGVFDTIKILNDLSGRVRVCAAWGFKGHKHG